MRSFWSQAPMLRVAFALITGIGLEIVADNYFSLSKEVLWIMTGLLIITITSSVIINNVKNVAYSFKLKVHNGLALTISIISFGYILTWFYTEQNYPNLFGNFLAKENVLLVKITEPPIVRENVITTIAEVNGIRNEKETLKSRGKILISFLKDSLSQRLDYGDVLLIKAKPEVFEEPKNPCEFNYKRYQGYRNIYYRVFLTSDDWKLLAREQGNFFFSWVYKLRDNFLRVIEKYVKDRNDFGVASAIMLGYRDYINGDILRAYASSGVIHVLSVSGLHVGIMFFMLNILLSGMNNRGRKLAVAKCTIIISFIWFYACITGLSPPVLRSALMFILIQVAEVLFRNKNIYNIVAGSAVILLLFNPFFAMDVGFQLSYIAVIGIVFLYPKISSLIIIGTSDEPRYKEQKNIFHKPVVFLFKDKRWFALKIFDSGWKIIAVSLAAQIATSPLSVFYFHQFPNLFLLSNLLVIPVSNLILAIGTALFAFRQIPYLGDAIGWSFNILLVMLDKFIFWIDQLPFALLQGISITAFEVTGIYVLILLLCWLTEEKKTKVLVASFLIVFGLCSFNCYKTIARSIRKEIVVYSVPKLKAIAFISGGKVQYDFDDDLLRNQTAMQYHVKPHWWDCGINEEEKVRSTQLPFGELISFDAKKILIVTDKAEKINSDLNKKQKVDLVIFSDNPKVNIEDLKKLVDFDEVVFDSSNKKWRINTWETDCGELNIKYWDVSTHGAFVREIKTS